MYPQLLFSSHILLDGANRQVTKYMKSKLNLNDLM